MMSAIEVHSPRTLAEAYEVLRQRSHHLQVLAGGTDLMVYLNMRLIAPREILNIWGLDELRGIRVENDALRIGALTTYTQIIHSPLVAEHCLTLIDAAKTIGAIQTQNRGTLGGNIVNASPAGDTLPVLAAFDATLEVGSHRGVRMIPFNRFYTGYRKTVLEADELLLAIHVPLKQPDEHLFFYKLGTRRAQAISKVVMAAKARINCAQTIESIQIGLGSVAPTVLRARSTEALLTGQILTPILIEQAKETIRQEIHPITDFRSTEAYRRFATGNLLGKFLRDLLESV
jgi:CO/xanthine dehydrogenase FAD-binding subunit